MAQLKIRLVAVACALVAGCVAQPTGPTVTVLPAPNKPFAVFQDDQSVCMHYADQQVAGKAEPANERQIGTAVIGTVLGAGLGAAVGGGRGAAVGAGTGAIAGTAIGAAPAQREQWSLQRRYDMAYVQCMYAKGNQVPGVAPAMAPPPPPPVR